MNTGVFMRRFTSASAYEHTAAQSALSAEAVATGDTKSETIGCCERGRDPARSR